MPIKKINGFTLIELLVVVAIIGILAAVGVVAYNGYTKAAKINAAKSNHQTVVKFIKTSLMKCEIGDELILKYSYSLATGELKYSNNVCSDSADASKMHSHFANHFNAPRWCNPHGLKETSGKCQQAVAQGGNIQYGKLGETQLHLLDGDLVIVTKVSGTLNVNDGAEIFSNTINLN